MSEYKLRNRKRFSTNIKKELFEEIQNLSQLTGIPKSKLTDEAFEDLLKKYQGFREWKEDRNK
ncbi:ribbon-helix-helix domain-containing protein [Thermoflavimicrobium daqui]|jgi:hypothetical protein|uniref:Predicted DNA-binding protein ribbon-helix-helix domain-containing protein n=1 Tax=Thermoflavimicrobium daqui TaxID=2137476 RepID=A0A364K1T9_9BACL|nr:ribbon-helix-helix domain-containing protein [Thermoflavimicrobium daqui]RAL22000.1 hypothetical protein DL897_15575 [Thermoflavimicrobium daqui]